jgi:hypothetical protein
VRPLRIVELMLVRVVTRVMRVAIVVWVPARTR